MEMGSHSWQGHGHTPCYPENTIWASNPPAAPQTVPLARFRPFSPLGIPSWAHTPGLQSFPFAHSLHFVLFLAIGGSITMPHFPTLAKPIDLVASYINPVCDAVDGACWTVKTVLQSLDLGPRLSVKMSLRLHLTAQRNSCRGRTS